MTVPVVFVITELGPCDEPAFCVQAVPCIDAEGSPAHRWAEWAGDRP